MRMIYVFVSILLPVLFINLQAQQLKLDDEINSKTVRWGASLTYNLDNYFYTLQPSIVATIDKNSFVISPKFSINSDVYASNFINGFDFTYKRFLFHNSKKIDLYASSDVEYTFVQHSENQLFSANTISYTSIYQHTLDYKQFTLGVGVVFKFRKFFIDQSLGFGFGQYSENYQLEVPLFPSANYNETGTYGIEFAHFYKIGIGYTF